jgi:hypothetical protein
VAKDEDWIAERLAEAAKQAPVTEAVATRMAGLIRTLLTDRALTSTELAIAAKALLDGMAATTSSKASIKPS